MSDEGAKPITPQEMLQSGLSLLHQATKEAGAMRFDQAQTLASLASAYSLFTLACVVAKANIILEKETKVEPND